MNKELCLDEVYRKTTQEDIPQTPEFEEEYERSRVFSLSPQEYYLKRKYSKDHSRCRILPNGLHRFGTIGGGFSVRFFLKSTGYEAVALCHGCKESINLTKESEGVDEKELTQEIMKESEIYGGGSLGKLEFLRFQKFRSDHKGHQISIGFMGTGLGYLINVYDEDTGEYAEITNTESW